MKEQINLHETTVNDNVADAKEREYAAEEETSIADTCKTGTEVEKDVAIEVSKDQKVLNKVDDKEETHYKTKEAMYHCKDCGYQCKKQVILNKHINTKHTKQRCKICDEECKTSIETLKHVAEKHNYSKDRSIKDKRRKRMQGNRGR